MMDLERYKDYEYELMITDVRTGETTEYSKHFIECRTRSELMTGAPNTLEVMLLDDGEKSIFITKGSALSFVVNGEPWFFGYVTNAGYDKTKAYRIRATSQKKWLRSTQTRYIASDDPDYPDVTAADFFARVCGEIEQMNHRIDASPRYYIPSYWAENMTLWEMIHRLVKKTNIAEANFGLNKYVVVEDYDQLVFTELRNLFTPVILKDGQYVMEYQFETSIEDNVYTKIVLERRNEEEGVIDYWEFHNTQRQSEWGIIARTIVLPDQIAETLAEEKVLIQKIGEDYLEYYSMEDNRLSLVAFGDLRVKGAGWGIHFDNERLQLGGNFITQSVTHVFTNNMHTMDLELIIIDPAILSDRETRPFQEWPQNRTVQGQRPLS